MKIFWNKDYEVINYFHDVTNQILLRGSNYIVDVVMWPKFGNSSLSTKEVTQDLNFITIWRKITLFLRGGQG